MEELANLPKGENYVHNADRAGNTIVSRITNTLGSLKTLSAYVKDGEDGEGNRNFNLFTHHKLLKEKKPNKIFMLSRPRWQGGQRDFGNFTAQQLAPAPVRKCFRQVHCSAFVVTLFTSGLLQ